jgi:CubicO group peptidase (beta-lactamase class C family)
MKRMITWGIAHGDVPKRLRQRLALAAAGARRSEDQSPWPLPEGELAAKTHVRFESVLATSALALMAACGAPAAAPPTLARPTTVAPTANPPPTAPAIVPPPVVLATPRPTDAARAPASDATVMKVVDDYVAPLAKQDKFSGAVLIARDGKVILNQGYGLADRVKNTPIETDTEFIVGLSLEWPAMAALALQLRDERRLSLDETVCAYVSACDNRFRPITLRLLLANMGGLPDERFVPGLGIAGSSYNGQYLAKLEKVPPERLARPGEAFQAVTLSGGARMTADWGNFEAFFAAIGGASGQHPWLIMPARLFAPPLNLKSFGAYKMTNYAKLAALRDATLPVEPLIDKMTPFVMTAADLNSFLQALFAGKLLSATQLDEMLRPVVKVDGAPGSMGYAMGAYVGTDPTGRRIVSQVDVAAGYGAYLAWFPDEKLTVIALNNLTDYANQPYRARDVGLELARRIGEAR